jgi:dTDP-4-amino-4,6-dideoxygalactose transaminase
MSGYKIKFNGIDRLYDAYSWRLSRRAKKVWQSGDVLQGRYLAQLEKEIAKKYKRKYAVGVGSATDGLYFSLRALGIQENDTVLCPVLSYTATAGAIKRTKANIHFVDVDKRGNISGWGIIGLPKAVVYVNLFGNPADYDRLRNYCDAYRIPLIEDAAQSQGAWYGSKPSGSLGDISVFSFDPMKNMPCFGTAGMVLTDKKETYDILLSLRRHGFGSNIPYGYNSLIPEDHAHQLLFLLSKFDKLQKMRSKVFERYSKNLSNSVFVHAQGNTVSSHHKLVILVQNRNGLKMYLERHGIETKIHYQNTLDDDNIRRYPRAKSFCDMSLSLPIYPYLKNDEIDFICEKIKEFKDV